MKYLILIFGMLLILISCKPEEQGNYSKLVYLVDVDKHISGIDSVLIAKQVYIDGSLSKEISYIDSDTTKYSIRYYDKFGHLNKYSDNFSGRQVYYTYKDSTPSMVTYVDAKSKKRILKYYVHSFDNYDSTAIKDNNVLESYILEEYDNKKRNISSRLYLKFENQFILQESTQNHYKSSSRKETIVIQNLNNFQRRTESQFDDGILVKEKEYVNDNLVKSKKKDGDSYLIEIWEDNVRHRKREVYKIIS